MEYSAYLIDRKEAIALSQKWIEDWGKIPIKKGMYGNIAMAIENDNGEIIYVGFIWESQTEMAMIGFITRNPNVRSKIKNLRRILIESMIAHIKKLGYQYISSWCADSGLKKDFLEIGCVETSNTVSEFFAELK